MLSIEQIENLHKMNDMELDHFLFNSCLDGNLEIVQYLLTSPDFNINHDYALRYACGAGHINIVNYLLTSTDLKEHPDIYSYDNHALKNALGYGHLELITYLIFDYNLEKTKEIVDYFIKQNRGDLLILFEKRDFEVKLQNNLNNNDHNNNKIKI